MSYFRESRNVQLSAIYFIENCISNDWSGISVVKSFVNSYKEPLPVICVDLPDTQNNWKEIGSTSLYNDYTINIDIFAKSHGQRMDLADYLIDKLKDGFTYYVHSQASGDPETLTRTADGRVFIHRFLSNNKLDFGEDGADIYDRFRHFLSIQVKKDIA